MADLERYKEIVEAAAQKTPRQLLGVVTRKSKNEFVPRLPIDVDKRYQRRIPDALDSDYGPHERDTNRFQSALMTAECDRYRRLATDFVDGRVTFLNRTRTVSDPASLTPDDERIADLPRLWYLKLAAFEPLRWATLGFGDSDGSTDITAAIESWVMATVSREPIAARSGYLRGFWTPYAVSLRILILCRYGARTGGLGDRLERFLYKNLCFLTGHIETDVGGNHLFENGAALVVGGVVFPRHGQRFVDAGLAVLESACEEQFLDDGYHYERSPMYHLAVTTRLLITFSVLQAADLTVPDWLDGAAERAAAYTVYLYPPDDRIPLLNDAVFDEADRLDSVVQYAESLGLSTRPPSSPGESAIHWLESESLSVLFDAGDSGPPAQLGHTHNDPCTMLAWSGDRRLIVDTGAFDYQPGRRRVTARSVRGHNTVQVKESEPASFSGRFAMSGVVSPTTTRTSTDALSAVTVRYEAGTAESYDHRRTCYEGPDWILVWDELDDERSWTSRLHAHPAVSIEGGVPYRFTHEDGPGLAVESFEAETTTVELASYFPRFGEEIDREVLVMNGRTDAFGYLLTEDPVETNLFYTAGKPTNLQVDGEQYSISSLQP